MLDVVPVVKYIEETTGTNFKNMMKDPKANQWNPHSQDIVSYFINMFEMFNE